MKSFEPWAVLRSALELETDIKRRSGHATTDAGLEWCKTTVDKQRRHLTRQYLIRVALRMNNHEEIKRLHSAPFHEFEPFNGNTLPKELQT